MKQHKHTITLVHANKRDFLELVTSKPKPEYKVRLGVPYWLFNHKGEIEEKNYITNENTTFDKLKELFLREQILTIKDRWNQ